MNTCRGDFCKLGPRVGRGVAPEQYIHVGLGAHIQHIREMLSNFPIAYNEQA